MTKPLEGIKVVELANYVAAPVASMLLAHMGADVIKIESTSGDPWRIVGCGITGTGLDEDPIYDVFNTNKKNLALNIKAPEGREILDKLIAEADVFITNTRIKSLKKMGLDPETLSVKYPGLVYGYIDGYGQKGPDAEAPGFDNFAFWSRSGFLVDMTCDVPGAEPTRCPTGMGDTYTGVTLYSEIVTALLKKFRTGKGDVCHASLFNVALFGMGSMIIGSSGNYNFVKWPKAANADTPLSTVYRCGDGEYGVLVGLDYKKAETIYSILGISDKIHAIADGGIKDWASMKVYKKDAYPIFAEAFMQKPVNEWVKLFKEGDIVFGRMAHFKDVQFDEQAWANDFLEKYTCVNGAQAILPANPLRLDSQGFEPSKTAALTGENTDEILKSLGYADDAIKSMHENGAVK